MRESRASRADTDKATRRDVTRGALAHGSRLAINAREDARRYDSWDRRGNELPSLIKFRIFPRDLSTQFNLTYAKTDGWKLQLD